MFFVKQCLHCIFQTSQHTLNDETPSEYLQWLSMLDFDPLQEETKNRSTPLNQYHERDGMSDPDESHVTNNTLALSDQYQQQGSMNDNNTQEVTEHKLALSDQDQQQDSAKDINTQNVTDETLALSDQYQKQGSMKNSNTQQVTDDKLALSDQHQEQDSMKGITTQQVTDDTFALSDQYDLDTPTELEGQYFQEDIDDIGFIPLTPIIKYGPRVHVKFGVYPRDKYGNTIY